MAGGIHSFFDLADDLLDTIGAPAAPQRRPSRSSRSSREADSGHGSPAPASSPAPQAAATTGTLARQSYRVIDSIDASTGAQTWVVTNGRDRAECSSQELAARVRAALG